MKEHIILEISRQELNSLIIQAVNSGLDAYGLNCGKNKEGDFLTVEQVASYLNLSKHTIRSKASKKEIPYHKPENGKRLYFVKKELDEWLLAGRKLTTEEIKENISDIIVRKGGKHAG